jgi:HSP20 family protein
MLTITRRDPFRAVSALQEQMSRFLEDSFFRGAGEDSAITAWAPAVDIFETEHELVLRADLPGLEEKDIDVRIENNMLTFRGERQFEKSVKEDNYLRVERSFGAFSRSFALPNTVNPDAIKAEYRNGVLTITLPKREESKPRQVKVSVSSNGK